MSAIEQVCYLCGRPIDEDLSADHVPPKQFFAPSVRAAYNLSRLVTLPAHGACNKSFESDEQYFAWSMAALCLGSTAADALVRDQGKKFRAGSGVGLGRKVLAEFVRQPSGLHLPGDRVIKRSEGERVGRVIWKLIRGFYFAETGIVLPETTPYTYEVVEPDRAAQHAGSSALWEQVKAQAPRGTYGGVFEHKYFAGEADGSRMHLWGMLLWDKLMIFAAHHDPASPDDQLRTANELPTSGPVRQPPNVTAGWISGKKRHEME